MLQSPLVERILEANPHRQVAAALQDDIEGAGLEGKTHIYVSREPRFNAITVLMRLMRHANTTPLVAERVIGEYDPDSLNGMLVAILNASIDPLTQPATAFDFCTSKPFGIKSEICGGAESGFLQAIYGIGSYAAKQFVDPEGQAVFIKKYNEMGAQTAVSLQPTSFNGIPIPAGTIVALQETDIASPELKTHMILPATTEHIAAVYPLRLSGFALTAEEKATALQTVDRNDQPGPADHSTKLVADLRPVLQRTAVAMAA